MRAGTVTDADVVITEVGGTVGDIESLPFLEALRQMRSEVGSENVVYIHTTLVPYLHAAGEMKTKPTQHSVKELRGLEFNRIFWLSERKSRFRKACVTKLPISATLNQKRSLNQWMLTRFIKFL